MFTQMYLDIYFQNPLFLLAINVCNVVVRCWNSDRKYKQKQPQNTTQIRKWVGQRVHLIHHRLCYICTILVFQSRSTQNQPKFCYLSPSPSPQSAGPSAPFSPRALGENPSVKPSVSQPLTTCRERVPPKPGDPESAAATTRPLRRHLRTWASRLQPHLDINGVVTESNLDINLYDWYCQ